MPDIDTKFITFDSQSEQYQNLILGDEWYSNVFSMWRPLYTFGPIPEKMNLDRFRRPIK